MFSSKLGGWVRFLSISLLIILGSGLKAFSAPMTIYYEPIERPQAYDKCFPNIERRLKEPGRLKIAVALGYSDTVDYGFDMVTDQFLLDNLGYQLKKPCKYAQQGFCNFKSQKEDYHQPFHYTRVLTTGDNQKILVDIFLMNSSYGFSHQDNVTTFRNEQRLQTETAQEFYGSALQNADVVFYEGHSRDGGGPDFSPPRRASNGKVNYSWYHKNQPGLKFLLSSLKSANSSPYYLGLFSCASKLHFKNILSKQVQDSSLILSTKVIEALYTKEALMTSLESVLNFECNDQLSKRIGGFSFIVHKVR